MYDADQPSTEKEIHATVIDFISVTFITEDCFCNLNAVTKDNLRFHH